jgi:hypothetical protein
MTGSAPPPGIGWEQLKEGCLSATFKLRHNPQHASTNSAKSDDQAGDVWTSMATEDIVAARGSQHHGCHGDPAHHYRLLQGQRQ